MAKLLNIYAMASDGTKVNATPSTIGAVPVDQVATTDTLGLVKVEDVDGTQSTITGEPLPLQCTILHFRRLSDQTEWYFVGWGNAAGTEVEAGNPNSYIWKEKPTEYYIYGPDTVTSGSYRVSFAPAVQLPNDLTTGEERYTPVLYFRDGMMGTEVEVKISEILNGTASMDWVFSTITTTTYDGMIDPRDQLDGTTGQQLTDLDGMGVGFLIYPYHNIAVVTASDGRVCYTTTVSSSEITNYVNGIPDFKNTPLPIFYSMDGTTKFTTSLKNLGTSTDGMMYFPTWNNGIIANFSTPTQITNTSTQTITNYTANRVIFNNEKLLVVDVDHLSIPTATTATYGTVKLGDNTVQGRENEKDVNYLEVNAEGVAFTPDYDINEVLNENPKKICGYRVSGTIVDTSGSGNDQSIEFIFYTDKVINMDRGTASEEDTTYNKYVSSIFINNSLYENYNSKEIVYEYEGGEYNIKLKLALYGMGDTYDIHAGIAGTDSRLADVTIDRWVNGYIEHELEVFNLSNPDEKHIIYGINGSNFELEDDPSNPGYKFFKYIHDDSLRPGDFNGSKFETMTDICFGDASGYTEEDYDDADTTYKTIYYSGAKLLTSKDIVTYTNLDNAVQLNDNKKLYVDGSQLTIPAASSNKRGGIRIMSSLLDGSEIPNIQYSGYGDTVIAQVFTTQDEFAYVPVLAATVDRIGSVKISDKYTDYGDNIDDQEVARLRISSDGYGFTTNLAATDAKLGHIKITNNVTDYTSLATLDYKNPVTLDANNFSYVHMFNATTNRLGCIKLSANTKGKYGAEGGDGSLTKFVELNSNGCAYIPFEKATADLAGVVQPDKRWMTINDGVTYPKAASGQYAGIVNVEPTAGLPGIKYYVLSKASAQSDGRYNNLVISPYMQKYIKIQNNVCYATEDFFTNASVGNLKYSAFWNSANAWIIPSLTKGSTTIAVDGVTYYNILWTATDSDGSTVITDDLSVDTTITPLALYQYGSFWHPKKGVEVALIYDQKGNTPSYQTASKASITSLSWSAYGSALQKYYVQGAKFDADMKLFYYATAGGANNIGNSDGLWAWGGTWLRFSYGAVQYTKTPFRVIKVTSDIYEDMYGKSDNGDEQVLAIDPATVDVSSLGTKEEWTFTLEDGSTVTKNVLLA